MGSLGLNMPLAPPLGGSQVRARERHVRLPRDVLVHHLDLIASVRGDPDRYATAVDGGAFYVDDALRHIPERPKEATGHT